MNDLTTFWPAFWQGFGAGLLVSFIAVADRRIAEQEGAQ